ncbi:30S ribosomal protein S17 [Candidatus Woesearchaeota archaeon]|nr:30S ribosomal protein S17 [Candidatus Woesearchaeota archaeon]RLE40878.1 MAG: 30S ribosomal protein S17 [Candidatus Woesearchaeota archaeon]
MAECKDKKCPFHGNVKIRGRKLKGVVIAKDLHRSATVLIERMKYLPKYERYEKRLRKIRVHNPSCIDADVGDEVMIAETRPLSKTKHFVIIAKK